MYMCRIIPPSPEVTVYLAQEYRAKWQPLGLTFQQFLQVKGYRNPARYAVGMDDPTRGVVDDHGAMSLAGPRLSVSDDLHVIVLLVDFPDLEGALTKAHYEALLFSRQTYLTGSMVDYYHEVSRGQVRIKGEVHGWLRLPQRYAYYTNGNSGLTDSHDREHYPRDARKLAEDAVEAALENGVTFTPKLDALGDGTLTALFIVHAGRGAEKLHPCLRGNHIWSHKWHLKQPKWVATNLWATAYLMVPQEALLGGYVHELGHLAFQWPDVYEPNYDDAGEFWSGNGLWDLMASGAYAGREMRPVHPAGIHKVQHRWIEAETIETSRSNVILKPVTQPDGKVIILRSRHYQPGQYLLLEYRSREAFDAALPGDGLLVWRVEVPEPQRRSPLAMHLIQAGGRHPRLSPDDYHDATPGDPFPGSKRVTTLTDTGEVSTSFPGGAASGITLQHIVHDTVSKEVRFDIVFKAI